MTVETPDLWLPPPQVDIQDDGVDVVETEGFQTLLSRALVTRDKVADNAHYYSSSGYYWGYGQCLKFSRTCAGAPGGVYDADAAWYNAKYKHTSGVAPRGTFSFYRGGAHGHVTVNEGNGMTWTTDYRRYGKIDLVPISDIERNWGMPRRGWTEDINGVHPLDTNGDWFDMATKADLDEVLQDRLIKFAEGDVLKNAIREGVQAELGDENSGELSDRIARKVWDINVTDPVDNQVKTMKAIMRYSNFRARKIVTSLKGTWS